jgi:hypothetical protein
LKVAPQILKAAAFIFFICISVSAQQDTIEVSDTAISAAAQPSIPGGFTPASPPEISAEDQPNDPGNAIIVEWDLAPGDNEEEGLVSGYLVYRSHSPEGDFELISSLPTGSSQFLDSGDHLENRYIIQRRFSGRRSQTPVLQHETDTDFSFYAVVFRYHGGVYFSCQKRTQALCSSHRRHRCR